MRKSKEDRERLKTITENLLQIYADVKNMKETIKALKTERNAIKEKYKKSII